MVIKILEKIYDLSYTISKEIPIYPNDPQPEFKPHHTKKKDNFNVTKIIIGSHTGTHIDAQTHFLNHGNSIDKEPLSKFIGGCIILDISKEKGIGKGISESDLENYSDLINSNDIILLYTGTSDNWLKDEGVRTNFSYLEVSAANWIVNHNVKCVGIDTPSIDRYGNNEGNCHNILLSSGVDIIENLNSNLKSFVNKRMFLVCLPLPLKGIDGSPCRSILFELAN
jgi:kynurenine formamidase